MFCRRCDVIGGNTLLLSILTIYVIFVGSKSLDKDKSVVWWWRDNDSKKIQCRETDSTYWDCLRSETGLRMAVLGRDDSTTKIDCNLESALRLAIKKIATDILPGRKITHKIAKAKCDHRNFKPIRAILHPQSLHHRFPADIIIGERCRYLRKVHVVSVQCSSRLNRRKQETILLLKERLAHIRTHK